MSDRLPSEFGADPIPQGGQIGTLKIDRPTSPQAHHDVLRLLAIDELKMRLFGIEKGLSNDARLLKKAEGSISIPRKTRRLGILCTSSQLMVGMSLCVRTRARGITKCFSCPRPHQNRVAF